MRIVIVFALASAAMALAGPAPGADECQFYTYRARVTEVIDGDTLRADVDLGFHVWVRDEIFRLDGIDAPETRAYAGREVSAAEKARGRAAKAALARLVEGRDVVICTVAGRREKYGRYLARIELDGLDVNRWLLEQGHAVPYGAAQPNLN